MCARGTFPRATVKAFMNQSQSLNHNHVQHRESGSKKMANYLKKKKSCRLGYYFKNAKRYGNHMLAAELQAVACVG